MCTAKILTDSCFTKQKTTFVKVIYSVLVVKMYWQNINKFFLSINDAESVRLEKRTIEFKNYFQQIPVSSKINADFECILSNIGNYECSYTKKYQDHIPCSFAYKLICVDDKFSKSIIFYRVENAAYKFIEAILKEYEYYKKVMKKHFNKNLVMTEDEEQFQSSNTYWICKRLIHDEKVRDHCHINRGTAH